MLDNDSDPFGSLEPASVTVVGAPGHGITSVDPATGAITYTPSAGYVGPDSFTYRVNDDLGADSNLATVSIDVLPSVTVSIGDVSASEGNLGTTNFVFTISLSAASLQTVKVVFFTSDGTASSGSDYQAISGTLSFGPGLTVQVLTVSVVGDTTAEPDETFYVNLSDAVNATLGASSGKSTILNDDIVASGLVAAYSFNEGSGNTVTDLSGHGNDGMVLGATWSSDGQYGDALLFNGCGSVVTIPDSASLRLTTGMTLEAWVLPTVVSNAWRDVIYKGNDNYYLEATSYYTKPAGGMIIGNSHVEAYGSSPLACNTWAHLAVTYDGTALRLYINGELVSCTPHTGNIKTSNNPLQIGGDNIFGQYFAGLIDEVRMYNRGLSASEIRSDMDTPLDLPLLADISGPAEVLRGEPADFTLIAIDSSPAFQAAPFAFIVDWGDGSPAETVTGVSGTIVSHTFNTAGPLTVSVTAADQIGTTSHQATRSVHVDAAQLRANAQNPSLVDLVWGGTPGDDQVELVETSGTTIRVHESLLDGTAVDLTQFYSGVTGRVLAYGNAGNDHLDARGLASKQATLDGGADNNTLYGGGAGDVLIGGIDGAEGQQGNNVIIAGNGSNTIYGNGPVGLKGSTGGNNLIFGGSGHDTIFGNYERVEKTNGQSSDGAEGGQNLIIGGGGSDSLYASQMADGAEGGHGSILVAGSTTLDESALLSILNEWTSTHSYADRIANISGTGSGPRNNGDNILQASVTIFDDGTSDDLFSDTNGELNWLALAFADDTSHRVKLGETMTDL